MQVLGAKEHLPVKLIFIFLLPVAYCGFSVPGVLLPVHVFVVVRIFFETFGRAEMADAIEVGQVVENLPVARLDGLFFFKLALVVICLHEIESATREATFFVFVDILGARLRQQQDKNAQKTAR